MTYSLAMDFVKPTKSGFPRPRIARIYVKTHTEDQRGTIFITPDCVTLAELDYQIERLHKELEYIRKEAKRKFSSCLE